MSRELSKRINRVRDNVKVHDIFYDLTGQTIFSSEFDQQVRCPLHGKDNKPSARLYASSGKFYCFVCHVGKKPLDAFSFFINIKNKSYKNGQDLLEALNFFENKFPHLLQIPFKDLKEELKDNSPSCDYNSLFFSKYMEVALLMTERKRDPRCDLYRYFDDFIEDIQKTRNFIEGYNFLVRFQDKLGRS